LVSLRVQFLEFVYLEEELLCTAQSCSKSDVPGGYVFAFQLTININFLKEDYYV